MITRLKEGRVEEALTGLAKGTQDKYEQLNMLFSSESKKN